jgi:hypothetical protein
MRLTVLKTAGKPWLNLRKEHHSEAGTCFYFGWGSHVIWVYGVCRFSALGSCRRCWREEG